MSGTVAQNVDRPPVGQPSSVHALLSDDGALNSGGEWLLVQLAILKYWADHQRQGDSEGSGIAQGAAATALPIQWQMTQHIDLWKWQRDCAQRWLEQGRRGIAKVVTGAGKTVFAQHLIERLQSEVDPELRVAIVVPTIVLMRQWVDSLTSHSNLPRQSVGCLWGGSSDGFSDAMRILVCVINSASTLLAERVRRAAVGEHLLLVVDECHRATGRSMSKVFGTVRRYNLGLSATPEREADDNMANETDATTVPELIETVITDELGPVIYELGVAEAVQSGILSTFEIRHYGLPLEPEERTSYEKLSRDIRELMRTLKAAAAQTQSGALRSLFRFAQHHARQRNSTISTDANQYLMNVRHRKILLYHARARTRAVLGIVSRTLAQSPESKILIFHESICEVMSLYLTLLRAGYRVTVDHSKLPDSARADSISLFRSSAAHILVSARTLIEGFDVPSADVGIIAASSTSPRQRIQTIGRVLRRPKDGTSKRAVIHTFYMARTVDEGIYETVDFAGVTGAERNSYFLWSPPPSDTPPEELASEAFCPREIPEAPRRPRPKEVEVDWTGLRPNNAYPGRFEGAEYRCDHQGNVLDMAGRPIANPQGVPDLVAVACGAAGRFKVTPAKRAILCWDRGARSLKFLGYLGEPFRVTSVSSAKAGRRHQVKEPDQALQFRVKQHKGQRRIQDYAGKFALTPGQAVDPEKGRDAVKVVEAIADLEKRIGKRIHELIVEGGEAYCIVNGQQQPLYRLSKGLEFKLGRE